MGTHLITNSTIRDIMTRVNLADMYHHTEQVICARPGELKVFRLGDTGAIDAIDSVGAVGGVAVCVAVLSAGGSTAVSVWEHVEFEGEVHGSIDLGGALVAALFVLKALGAVSLGDYNTREVKHTLSWIDRTLGNSLMLV